MKFALILIPLVLVSCSQFSQKAAPKQEPVKISMSEVNECRQYQQDVLDKAYREVKNKKKKTSELMFNPNRYEARALISKFDVEKGLTKKKSALVSNILNQCNGDLIKKFDQDYKTLGTCSLMFSELSYFQSLASALKNFPWPTDLKLEGKKVALDYVRYFSEGDFPLLNRLVALSVLDELSVNEVVNKNLHNEIKVVMEESRIYVEGLRAKLNQDPSLSCDSLGVIREELEYSRQVAKKMQGFLARI